MALNLAIPEKKADLKPRIVVLGVGGAGGNAVNTMIQSELQGVEFVVANTDAQALTQSLALTKIQLGGEVTRGLGAGSKPEIGAAAADESIHEVLSAIQDANLVFVAAGMGGGTGTGAAPVIAKAARDLGILTVAVVTKPFRFEGAHRTRMAEDGIEALQTNVDTLITIPNQNLFRVANERTTFADAFKMADDVLYEGVRGISDLMVQPGLINLDFADVRALMSVMGKAMMGLGEGEGDCRAIEAAEAAISNPLLEDASMRGAKGVLINIAGGSDLTLFEVDEAANRIREEVDPEANIIFGSSFDPVLQGRIRISVVATGIVAEATSASQSPSVNQVQSKQVEDYDIAAAPQPIIQPTPQPAPLRSPQPVQHSAQPVAEAPQPFARSVAPVSTPTPVQSAPNQRFQVQPAPQQAVEMENTSEDDFAPTSAHPYPEHAEQPPYVSPFGQQTPPARPTPPSPPSFLSAIQNPAVAQNPTSGQQIEARDVTRQHVTQPSLQAVPVHSVADHQTHDLKAEMPTAASSSPTTTSGFAKSAGLFSRIQNFAKAAPQQFGASNSQSETTRKAAEPAAVSDLFAQTSGSFSAASSPMSASTPTNEPVTRGNAEFDEDLLEIPAFLRRQAN